MSLQNSRAEVVLERFERGDYLGIAEVVCPQERKGVEISESILYWDSRAYQHFETPIALEDVKFSGSIDDADITVLQARFHVFGEDEMYVLVNRENQAFVRSDPLSKDVVGAFTMTYAVHPHLVCLESLRQRRADVVAKLEAANQQKQARDRKRYTVKLDGVIQADI